MKRHTIFPLGLGLLGLLLGSILLPSPALAQIDIFDQPGRRRPPPRRRGFTFGPIRTGSSGATRKLMAQAGRYYSQRNYLAASLKYYTVVKQKTGTRLHQVAEYQLAKCLFRLNLFHASLDYFTNAIRTGPSHRHFRDSLTWVIQISRRLKNESMFLSKLKKFRIADFPRKYRNELLYLLGKYYYQRKDIPKAKRLKISLRLLQQVQSRSRNFYPRARYIIGAIYDSAGRPNNAARSFKQSLRASLRMRDSKGRRKIFEMSILALARIHYGAKHFRGAIRYYKWIPKNSPRWLDSLFESAWAYLQRGMYEHTLGILHTLQSPYFLNEYYPETGILRAVSFFYSCRYKDVKSIVQAFLARYRPLVAEIKRFLKQNPTPKRFFRALRNIQQQGDTTTPGLDDDQAAILFQRILNMTFQDKNLRRTFVYIKEIDRELQLIRQSQAVWRQSSLAADLTRRLRNERKKIIKQAGLRGRNRFLQAQAELQELISQALKIQYETLGAEKELLRKSAAKQGSFTMRVRGRKKKARKITVSTHDDYIFWPFQGEYWVDELGYYRYRIKGECKRP